MVVLDCIILRLTEINTSRYNVVHCPLIMTTIIIAFKLFRQYPQNIVKVGFLAEQLCWIALDCSDVQSVYSVCIRCDI